MEQRKTTVRSTKVSSPIRYNGNIFFLILFLIIWLPVGMLLLLRNGCILTHRSTYTCHYHGSWGWLFFWGFLFFPVATILLLIKRVDVIEEVKIVEEETLIERY